MEDTNHEGNVFLIKSEIKDSKIAGKGRFFLEDYPKDTIVRIQRLHKNDLRAYKSMEEMIKDYENIETIKDFAHTVYTKYDLPEYNDTVFINKYPTMCNHSEDNTIYKDWSVFKETGVRYVRTFRDVKKGEEVLEDYTQFREVKWFEDFFKEKGIVTVRALGLKLKKN